jgi:hypothetical protein
MKMEGKVTSCVYLENGALILGGDKPSTWMVDCWPFRKIACENCFNEPCDILLELPGQCFASVLRSTVKIWNFDLEILNKFETKGEVREVFATATDTFLIQTSSHHILICDYKTGEIRDNFRWKKLY